MLTAMRLFGLGSQGAASNQRGKSLSHLQEVRGGIQALRAEEQVGRDCRQGVPTVFEKSGEEREGSGQLASDKSCRHGGR